MKRVVGYGLVVLAALGTRCALASPEAVGLYFAGKAGAPARAQGYLGVDVRDIGDDQAAALKLKPKPKEARGAEIVTVDHDAPAGKVGLREHDVVLQMNGQAIEGEEQLRRMLRESLPGKTIVLLISRDGQQMSVTAQMANREEVERKAWQQHLTVPEPQDSAVDSASAPSASSSPIHGNSFIGTILMNPSYTGAMLEPMSMQLAQFFGVTSGGGLLVRSVASNSPAEQAGIRAGDVVLRADSKQVTSAADWAKAIKNGHGQPMSVTVLRDKKEQTLTLKPDPKKRSSLERPGMDSERDELAHIGFSWMPRS